MPKVVIDNWLGGLAPSDKIGRENSYYWGEAASPIRDFGYLMPGSNTTKIAYSSDASPIITNYINSWTIDPKNSKYYLIEHSSKIHQGQLIGYTLTNDSYYPHSIGDDLTGHSGHSGFTGEDIIIYPIGSTHYLFYSWNDDTDADIGRAEIGTATPTFEDDYYTNTLGGSVLTKGVPHQFLEWQENGMLYCTNGNKLIEIDGINSSIDDNAFTLPVGWVITNIFDAGNLIGICATYTPGSGVATYASRAAVFFWDGSSSKFLKKISLPDVRIWASVVIDGIPYLLSEGVDNKGYIRKWNGTTFEVVQNINNNIIYGYDPPATFGAVCKYKNGFLFTTNRGGNIYYYGSYVPGISPALYNISKAKGTTYTYAIMNIAGVWLVSSQVGTGGSAIYYWEHQGGGDYKGFRYRSLYYEFPQKIRVNYVKVYFKTLESGCDDDVKLETDYGTTTTLGSISYANDGAVENKRFNCKILCHSFKVIIETDGGNSTNGITYAKIVVDYDYVGDI